MIVGISGYIGNKLTGIGRVLIEVLNEMAPLDRNDEYILFKNFDFEEYDVLKKHSNIKLVDIKISKNSSLGNIKWHQWAFQKLLKKYKCDVSYIPNFSLLLWKRIPTVVTIHDLIEYNVKDKFSKVRMIYRKIIDPLMVKNSTFITTVSECSKRDIMKFCNAKESKIGVIANAADRNRFKEYPVEIVDACLKKFNLTRKEYVLCVGTIDYPGKNIMSAIKGYERLRGKHDIKEKLVIVGKAGFNAQVIYDYVNQSKFKDGIIFTGYISDRELPLLYCGAKIMIYLSFYEGFGLPVLEAMSCGTAVLSSNTSCFPEVIGNIEVGVVPTDIEAIEEKLYQLVSDNTYNKEIAKQCYERAKFFSWKESAIKYYEVFKKSFLKINIVLMLLFTVGGINAQQKIVYLNNFSKSVDFEIALKKAIADIDDKRLILPPDSFDIGDVTIQGHKNFSIVGNSTIVSCGKFTIRDCCNFDIKSICIRGTKSKFAYFNIIGNCHDFKIHECNFDSPRNAKDKNMFYGIHVMGDFSKPKMSFYNSPRRFSIYDNRVSNTRYDGILVHACCSDFKIHHNLVNKAGCIGVEVEGRCGGNQSTTVCPCRKSKVYKNIIRNCDDWGILLMWVDGIKIYRNKCINNYGAFLSIGCKSGIIKYNTLEGREKGFEISQEVYSVEKGVNDGIEIYRNKIKGKARYSNYGSVDFRHCRNVIFRDNIITVIPREGGANIAIMSADNVLVRGNIFIERNKSSTFISVIKGNVIDPETKKSVNHIFFNNNILLKDNFLKNN